MKYVAPPKRRNVLAEQMATLADVQMQNVSTNVTQSIPSQLNSVQLVPWRSAFWALVGLALNTFTQSPGKVLGFPEKSGRCLRTSPIICLADTIFILLVYLVFRCRGKSHVGSARCIVKQRELQPTTGRDERTLWFKSVLFFGALTQAVKLFGMHGIIATQVIGMIYLVAYAVIEVLQRSAGSDWQRDSISISPDIERLNKGLKTCNIIVIQLQRVAWTWIISSLGSDEMVKAKFGIGGTASSRTLLQRILHVTTIASTTLCLGLCATFLALCAVYGISCCCGRHPAVNRTCNVGTRIRGMAKSVFLPPNLEYQVPDLQPARQESHVKSRNLLKFVLFNFLTHGAHIAIWIPHFTTWNSFYNSINLARLAVAFHMLICVMLVHFLAFKIVSYLYMAGIRQIFVADDLTRGWAAFHFAVSNIIVSMVYYAYLYDSKGTRKLPWTDNLG